MLRKLLPVKPVQPFQYLFVHILFLSNYEFATFQRRQTIMTMIHLKFCTEIQHAMFFKVSVLSFFPAGLSQNFQVYDAQNA